MDFKPLVLMLLCMTVAGSCSKKEPFERELGLQSRRIELSSSTGITPVMVFSNTLWTAKFTAPVDWASLDRLSGQFSSQVKLAFGSNYGRARKVAIAFEAGASKDTLVVIQEAGIRTPELSLTPSSLSVGADVLRGKVILSTNFADNIPEVETQVSYGEGSEGWISGVSLKEDSLEFQMSENTTGESRKATITLIHTDAYDQVVKAQLFIVQNPA